MELHRNVLGLLATHAQVLIPPWTNATQLLLSIHTELSREDVEVSGRIVTFDKLKFSVETDSDVKPVLLPFVIAVTVVADVGLALLTCGLTAVVGAYASMLATAVQLLCLLMFPHTSLYPLGSYGPP